MKKLFTCVAVLAAVVGFQASAMANEPLGFVYSDFTQPGIGNSEAGVSKMGTAVCTSYFGMVALGDCSVRCAMKNGKISTLSHSDQHVKNILGYKKVTTKAYGN